MNVPSGLADHVTTSLMRAEARRKLANDRSQEVKIAAAGSRSRWRLTGMHLLWICCATFAALVPYKMAPPPISQEDQSHSDTVNEAEATDHIVQDYFSQMYALASDEANRDTAALIHLEGHHKMLASIIDWGAIANTHWKPNASHTDLQACLGAAEASLRKTVSRLSDAVIGGFLNITKLRKQLRSQRQDVISTWVGKEIPVKQVSDADLEFLEFQRLSELKAKVSS